RGQHDRVGGLGTGRVGGEVTRGYPALVQVGLTPNRLYRYGRRVMELTLSLTGRTNPMAREPQRSSWTPAAMGAVVTERGFTVTGDRDMLTVAHDSGVAGKRESFLSTGRLLVADRH
ncbi:hypothetical protein, partial [Nocardia sp. NPDC004722]